MNRIKTGDTVQILTGDDRGKIAKVLRVIPKKNQIVVEGVNQVHKHLRRSQQHPQGGRITKEAPIHISNVTLYDEAKSARVRVRFETSDDGQKVRVSRKDGSKIADSIRERD